MIALLLLFIVTFGAGTSAAVERRETVPARFVGEWVADLKRCGADRDDSRLRLDADRIRIRESGGPIRAVVARGELELALIAEMSGEGETWLARHRLRLSADRERRIDATGETEFARYRCPKRAKWRSAERRETAFCPALLPLASIKRNNGLERRGQPHKREPFRAVALAVIEIQDSGANLELYEQQDRTNFQSITASAATKLCLLE